MRRPRQLNPQRYTAHETQRMIDLEGVDLASFRSRFVAFGVDVMLVFSLVLLAIFLYQVAVSALDPSHDFNYKFRWSVTKPSTNILKVNSPQQEHGASASPSAAHESGSNEHEEDESILGELWELLIPISYWGLLTWATNGRTPGKWVAGIRVASTSHDHVTLWQSTERALGYSASALELGFGFFQYFITPNRRTTHDRIAETIVIKDKDRRLFRSLTSRLQRSHEPVWGDAHLQPAEQERSPAEV